MLTSSTLTRPVPTSHSDAQRRANPCPPELPELPQDTTWDRLERSAARTLGAPLRFAGPLRIGMAVPLLLVFSLVLWGLAALPGLPPSLNTMRHLTLWFGTLMLVLEGAYLTRVVAKLLWLAHRKADQRGGRANLGSLRQALLPVLNVLLGIFLFAAIYYRHALSIMTEREGIEAARLLWMMCTGGLMLVIAFGELFLRTTELIAAAPDDAAIS